MSEQNEALRQTVAKHIEKQLFPAGSFYVGSVVDKGIAINAETVTVPQSVGATSGGVNPTHDDLPLAAKGRKDGKKFYETVHFYTNPTRVMNVEEFKFDYSKRELVLDDHIAFLKNMYRNTTAKLWTPQKSANIIRSTGEAMDFDESIKGQRLMASRKDWMNARKLLTKQGVPNKGRRALVSGDDYNVLLEARFKDFITTDQLSADLVSKGVIAKFMGFDLYEEATALFMAEDDSAKTAPVFDFDGNKIFGDTIEADDFEGILCFHPKFVRRAEGEVNAYVNLNQGSQLGSTTNAEMKGGGMINRLDERGVVAIKKVKPTV